MSELFLVLRRRLDEVAKWVTLDTQTLRSAREALGLSYEAVARNLGISAKTWERYEKDGRVPRWQLPQIAELLKLEIAEMPPAMVTVASEEDESLAAQVSDLRAEVAEVKALLMQLLGQAS